MTRLHNQTLLVLVDVLPLTETIGPLGGYWVKRSGSGSQTLMSLV